MIYNSNICVSVSVSLICMKCMMLLTGVRLPRFLIHFTLWGDLIAMVLHSELRAVADAENEGGGGGYKILTRMVWPAICGVQCTIVS